MKNMIWRSAVISVFWGAIALAISHYLTASDYAASPATGSMEMLHGLEAVSHVINSFGILGYAKSLLGPYALYVGTIFIGCVVMGIWSNKQNGREV